MSLHLRVEGREIFKGQRGLEFPGPVPVHGSRSVVDEEWGEFFLQGLPYVRAQLRTLSPQRAFSLDSEEQQKANV